VEYYKVVPKEREANLAYRLGEIGRGNRDEGYRKELRERCRVDLFYWMNVFCWAWEPRLPAKLPAITSSLQDLVIPRIDGSIGKRHVVVEKSRDMRITWSVLFVLCNRWQFWENQSFAIASRAHEFVDKPGSPGTLFWKLDFILKNQPEWLLPEDWHRSKNQLNNFSMASDFTGYATTKDLARSDRRLAIFLDEYGAFDYAEGHGAYASCVQATKTVLMVSTHQGTVGAFADVVKRAKKFPHRFELISMPWWQDPDKAVGLEWREGKRWSPWWQEMKDNSINESKFLEEVEMDPMGAGAGYFSGEQIAQAEKTCRPAAHVGRLEYDLETLEPVRWIEDGNGPLSLWGLLPQGKPVADEYALGVDVSAGVGRTPSTMAVVSKRTGEKVGEFVHSRLLPEKFAGYAIAVAKWFHGAQLIWETAGGTGVTFGKVVKDRQYRPVYFRRTSEDRLCPVPTDAMGWGSTASTKRDLLENFRKSFGYEYTERSAALLEECQHYRYAADGTGVEHAQAVETDDPMEAGQNHGDLIIAAALAWKLVKESRLLVKAGKAAVPRVAPVGSIAWIREKEKREQADRELFGGLRL
jgi:hypothetical protein